MRSVSKQGIFYGWFVFAACFLMVFTALGFCSSPKSLFLAAITEDLGIPRSLFSINDSIRYITTAVANVFFGFLVAKFGSRRLIFGGFLALIASCLVYSFSSSIVMFCIGGCLLGLGLSWTTTTMVGMLVERWFASNKGSIMGIILAANGLGGAISIQVINRLIYSDGGWRLAYRTAAVILAVVGVIVVLVVRNRPEEMGLKPMAPSAKSKQKTKSSVTAEWEGIPFRQAVRMPCFYVALVCVYLTGMILQSTGGVSSAHMKDCGIDPSAIAAILSIHSLILMASKIGTGFCFDKLGLRPTLIICYLCGLISITSLALVSNTFMAGLYSFVSPFALPLETIMLPLIAKDLFGYHSYSRIMGLFVSINTLGYATGAPIMNLMFDLTGTYRPTMLVMVLLMLVVAVTMQFVITSAHKLRRNSVQ